MMGSAPGGGAGFTATSTPVASGPAVPIQPVTTTPLPQTIPFQSTPAASGVSAFQGSMFQVPGAPGSAAGSAGGVAMPATTVGAQGGFFSAQNMSAITDIAGQIGGAASAFASARTNTALGRLVSGLTSQAIADERLRGAYERFQIGSLGESLLGTARATRGGSGVAVGTGSPLLARQDLQDEISLALTKSALESGMRMGAIEGRGALNLFGLRQEARRQRLAGVGGLTKAIGTLSRSNLLKGSGSRYGRAA